MNTTRTSLVVLIIAVIALVLVGVFTDKRPSESVTLGVIAGTTGDYAAAGEAYVKGFNLALDQWNATHERKFEAVIEDDGFNAQKGVAAYQKLKSADNVDAYAVLSSFTIDATIDSLHAEGKPVALGFEQSTPATDDNVFQVLPAAAPVQEGLGKHLKEQGFMKPTVVYSNTSSVYENFLDGFKRGYGKGTTDIGVGSMSTGASALATKILAEKPDVIVFYMNPKDGALLVKELARQSGGQHPQFAFDQSVQSGINDYKTVLGDALAQLNGSIVAYSKNDLTQEFKDLYQATYDAEPPFAADMGYNSFMLLANTYNAQPEQWISNMKKASFIGADGSVSFDSNGLRLPTTSFGTFKDGSVQ